MFDRSMPKRRFANAVLRLGVLVVAARAWMLASPVAADQMQRPNILFIMTDQHRYDCLGANGNPLIKTPHLDQLAARSANFQSTFVQAPVCVPSRATWFTGRYPHSHKNRVNYTPLKRDEVLMPRILRDAGYATATVGKLHLYPPTPEEARRVGFDYVQLHDAVPGRDEFSDYVKWRRANDPRSDTHYRRVASDIEPGKNPFRAAIDKEYTESAWVGLKTREYIAELAGGDKPFFIYASFWKPHSPHEVPRPYDEMYDDVEIPLPDRVTLDDIKKLPPPLQKLILRGRPSYDMDRDRLQWIYRSYYAAVSQIDHEVGLMVQALESAECADNTIVIFTSDHGDQLLEHGFVGKNAFYEASIRIPFLMSYPGRIRAGVYDELIETTDFVPTLCELIGIDEPRHCQGRSFAPLVGGVDRAYLPRDVVFCENIIPEVINGYGFFFEKGKGVGGVRHPDAKMVRSKKWKYNYYPDGFAELYDLENDPGEKHNLVDREDLAEVIAAMKDRLLRWMITADETEQIAEKWLR